MMLIIAITIIGAAFAICLAGFFAGLETAAYGASMIRLRCMENEGDSNANGVLRLLANIPELVTTTLIGHNLAVYIGTFLVTKQFEERHIHEAELWATLLLTPFCFIFAETLPKRIAHSMANQYVLQSLRITLIAKKAFTPLGLILGGVGKLVRAILAKFNLASIDTTGRQKLSDYLEAGMAEGLLTKEQHQMTQRIMAVSDITVREVMLPVSRAFSVRDDITCREAAQKMLEAGKKRAPVSDRSGKFTTDIITLNEIMHSPECMDMPVSTKCKAAMTVSPKRRLHKTLQKMKEDHRRLAIVTGRDGSPIGVVSICDLLGCIISGIHL